MDSFKFLQACNENISGESYLRIDQWKRGVEVTNLDQTEYLLQLSIGNLLSKSIAEVRLCINGSEATKDELDKARWTLIIEGVKILANNFANS